MEKVLIRNEDVIWREIDGKVVIISVDALATYVLNKTAARIWKLSDGTKEPEEIVADICDSFDVLPEEAGADVKETINKFEEMGLLIRK